MQQLRTTGRPLKRELAIQSAQLHHSVELLGTTARDITELLQRVSDAVSCAERTGLTNEHLEYCHALVRIPASEDYASLNLAMAVQLVAYELFRARGVPALERGSGAAPLASAESGAGTRSL